MQQAIGDTWPINLHELRGLEKFADNKEMLTKLQRVKHVSIERVPSNIVLTIECLQWRRQRSNGARSFIWLRSTVGRTPVFGRRMTLSCARPAVDE